MKKHPLFWFYALAFGLAWLGWLPSVLASRGVAALAHPAFGVLLLLPAVGPALAAGIVTRAAHGREGLARLFGALAAWRVHPLWYGMAVGAPAALLLAAQYLTRVLALPAPPAFTGEPLPVVMSALVMSALANPWEEVGWRGFALPRWQARFTALQASLVVGILWGVWHLPLFFWVGNPMSTYPFLPWLAGTAALAVLYTWLYNSTQGSLLPVTLFHVALNTWGVLITGVSTLALSGVHVLAAALLVLVFGGAHLTRQPRIQIT
ncbi:MAG: type II CAAX endopeptidase family protein [Anaerolineales bacterium]